MEEPKLSVKVPGGIGDIAWIYAKLCRRPYPVKYIPSDDRPHRSMPFIDLLPKAVGSHYGDFMAGQVIGFKGGEVTKVPEEGEHWVSANQHIEQYKRIETWLPDDVMDFHFYMDISIDEFKTADRLLRGIKHPLILYPSSVENCKISRWKAPSWARFAKALAEKWDMSLVLLGAEWDRELMRRIHNEFREMGMDVPQIVAQPFGVAMAVIQRASYFLGFQSGLGVLATMLNTPSCMLLGSHLPGLVGSWAPPHQIESGRYRGVLFQDKEHNRVDDNWEDAYKQLEGLDPAIFKEEGLIDVCIVVCDKYPLITRIIDRHLEFCKGKYRLIVVDNASGKDVEDYLLRLSNQGLIRLMRIDHRVGTARGRNIAFKFAKKEFLVSMDDDAWPRTPDWYVPLIEALKAYPRAGLVGPCGTRNASQKGMGGWVPHGYENAPQFGEETPSGPTGLTMDTIPGMCVGIRREALLQTEFFDPRYEPFNAEDADLCMQLKAVGWEIRIAQAEIDHAGGGQSSHRYAEAIVGRPMEQIADDSMKVFFSKWRDRDDLLEINRGGGTAESP